MITNDTLVIINIPKYQLTELDLTRLYEYSKKFENHDIVDKYLNDNQITDLVQIRPNLKSLVIKCIMRNINPQVVKTTIAKDENVITAKLDTELYCLYTIEDLLVLLTTYADVTRTNSYTVSISNTSNELNPNIIQLVIKENTSLSE